MSSSSFPVLASVLSSSFATIPDRHQTESLRRGARPRERTVPRVEHLSETLHRQLSSTGPEQRADDAADHAAEETIRIDLEAEDVPLRDPLGPCDRPFSRLPRCDCREVV